jgi:hypothetical protein
MSSLHIDVERFPYDWVVKRFSLNITYRQAFLLEDHEAAYCGIVSASGGWMLAGDLAGVLGFNVFDDFYTGITRDEAEEKVFRHYLDMACSFDLLRLDGDSVILTGDGREALLSGIKYVHYQASIDYFESKEVAWLPYGFSYLDNLGLENKIERFGHRDDRNLISDTILKDRLQFQLFNNDHFNGDVTGIYAGNKLPVYETKRVECCLANQNTSLLVYYNNEEKPLLGQILGSDEHQQLLAWLIRLGRHRRLLSSGKRFGLCEIIEFMGLWNWAELAVNEYLDWTEPGLLQIFKENADVSTWVLLGQHLPVAFISSHVMEFRIYWPWDVLSERLDNGFIIEHILSLPWDFEVLSGKDVNWVMSLLSIQSLELAGWDWSILSERLPDDFILENIDRFDWDFHLLTRVRFDVFKAAFNKAWDAQLSRPWDWNFVSGEAKLKFLYQHKAELSGLINWPIVLERFFNDPVMVAICVADAGFAELVSKALPENFVIAQQNYIWNKQTIDFFDGIGRINWPTTSYLPGFDTNSTLQWTTDIFNEFSFKVNSPAGFKAVSASIKDPNLILAHRNFKWNWVELSHNENVFSNEVFLTSVLKSTEAHLYKLSWDIVFQQHDLKFWYGVIFDFAAHTNAEENKLFWAIISEKGYPDFALDHFSLDWDWSVLTRVADVSLILERLSDEAVIARWDWKLLTRKLRKDQVLQILEIGTGRWDWGYLLTLVFDADDLTIANGQLSRLAACLHLENYEIKTAAWKLLTALFPFEQLLIYVDRTIRLPIFEWDWDYLSGHRHLPTDLLILRKFRNKLNWSVLSSNSVIKAKFNYSRWPNDRKGCSDNIKKYLIDFKWYWDWSVLSQIPDLHWDRALILQFRDVRWDWKYLSEFGTFLLKKEREGEDYLLGLLKRYPIDFIAFSRRNDVIISDALIRKFNAETWDWHALAANPKVKITSESLTELSDKPWDWSAISEREDLEIGNALILDLLDKDWDWQKLSARKHLVFDFSFLAQVSDKGWDWQQITYHKTFEPSSEILNLLANKPLDWQYISGHRELGLTNELINRFKLKWDWIALTRNPMIDFSVVDMIARFSEFWDWAYICSSTNFPLNEETLETFKSQLDWDALSANTVIQFTTELIDRHQSRWNWSLLKMNFHLFELLGDHVQKLINQSPRLRLIDGIAQQKSYWGGFVYHFSHVDNAVQIIKNKKVQSRNRATILGDAAGSVVHRRNDAHSFARFYFRPKTPTQFYNEFLGVRRSSGYQKDGLFVSWYDRSRVLGYPKCPVPIFFSFSLQELLFRFPEKCHISNGNMQSSWVRFGSVDQMVDLFNTDDLFISPEKYSNSDFFRRYLNYTQQEFLFSDELDFSQLATVRIFCASEENKKLLVALLEEGNEEWVAKIVVDPRLYNFENPMISVREFEDSVVIRGSLPGEGYLKLEPFNEQTEQVVNGDVDRVFEKKLIFSGDLTLSPIKHPFRITFTDESKREWFIFEGRGDELKNRKTDDSPEGGDLQLDRCFCREHIDSKEVIGYLKTLGYALDYESIVRHYTIEVHTSIVCGVFEEYFAESLPVKDQRFFVLFLVLHDIGKFRAFSTGNKDLQYQHTLDIIAELKGRLPFSVNEQLLVEALLSDDDMGNYYQQKLTISKTVDSIVRRADRAGIAAADFFRYLMIYYQCDTAAYTADAGGIKFLEHLFEYRDGKKHLDGQENLLRLEPVYWDRYLVLKKEIDLCQ